MPQGRNSDHDPLLRQAPTGFGQRQVRRLLNPIAYPRLPADQARAAMATHSQTAPHPALLPTLADTIHPHAADFEAPRNGRRTLPPLQRPQYPVPQILRIRVHAFPPRRTGKA